MIKCNLSVLLAERNLKITKVSNDTGISRTTLTALNNNSSQGVQFETLNKLCNYLNITPDKLFLYTPYDIEINIIKVSDMEITSKIEKGKNIDFELNIKSNKKNISCHLIASVYFTHNNFILEYSIPIFEDKKESEIYLKNLKEIKEIILNIPLQFVTGIDEFLFQKGWDEIISHKVTFRVEGFSDFLHFLNTIE